MTDEFILDQGVDALRERYEASLRHIAALPEIAMRRASIDAALAALPTDEVVWWIDQLIRGALWGRNPEIDAMIACSDWLVRLRLEDDYERIQSLYEHAMEAERESVLYLLRDPPPHRVLPPNARLPEVKLPIPREVSLGERRSLARGQDRRILERLLYDPDPLVVEKLLDNPRLRIQEALTVATRRPTRPELLMTIVLKERWFREQTIREAIVYNPFAPTGVSLKLLPTLKIHTLRRIMRANDLHPHVSAAARLFVELREQRTAPWKV